MKWSWKITTISGIDVFIHATFLLIIAWVGFSYWQQTGTLTGTLEGILFTLLLFGCVVLHEVGPRSHRPALWHQNWGHHPLPDRRGCPAGTYARQTHPGTLGSAGRSCS